MASTYLSKAISTNNVAGRKTMTFSAWIKRATASATSCVFATGSGAERDMILFESDGKLQFSRYDSSYIYMLKTNRQFRDVNAWYHLMCVLDTTQGTASNRMKIYVNGVQETSFNTANYPSQDYQSNYSQSGYTQFLGQDSDGNFDFDGCMSHVHYVDGTALTPSTFGSTDATTGEWKINTSPSVTYGTNGFFLLKDDNAVTDRSGEGNNFTLGAGTLTKTEDCPSNVFATMNPLSSLSTFSQGNNRILFSSGSGYQPSTSTLGMVSGKFYAEVKIQVEHGNYPGIGIAATNSLAASKRDSDWLGEHSDTYGYYLDGVIYNNGGTVTSGQTTFTTGDIVGLALDLDSAQNTLKYYKNGSLVYTLNINTNSNGYMFGSVTQVNTSNAAAEWNFGNGVFGSSQLTGTTYQASGIGIFKYQPPTNYTALSTKGLNL